jgi:hypothetical protein
MQSYQWLAKQKQNGDEAFRTADELVERHEHEAQLKKELGRRQRLFVQASNWKHAVEVRQSIADVEQHQEAAQNAEHDSEALKSWVTWANTGAPASPRVSI